MVVSTDLTLGIFINEAVEMFTCPVCGGDMYDSDVLAAGRFCDWCTFMAWFPERTEARIIRFQDSTKRLKQSKVYGFVGGQQIP